jgi:hypothetical protein
MAGRGGGSEAMRCASEAKRQFLIDNNRMVSRMWPFSNNLCVPTMKEPSGGPPQPDPVDTGATITLNAAAFAKYLILHGKWDKPRPYGGIGDLKTLKCTLRLEGLDWYKADSHNAVSKALLQYLGGQENSSVLDAPIRVSRNPQRDDSCFLYADPQALRQAQEKLRKEMGIALSRSR